MAINAEANFLAHHQVKGAKHGVRRYQNEDGSLTPLGREHRRLTRPSRAGKSKSTEPAKKKPTLKEVYEASKQKRAAKKEADVAAKKKAAQEAETQRLAKQQEEVQRAKAAQEKYVAEAKHKAMYTKNPKELYDNMQYLDANEAKAAAERMANVLKVQEMIPKQQTKWDKAMKTMNNFNEYYKTISTTTSNANKLLKSFGIDLESEFKNAMKDSKEKQAATQPKPKEKQKKKNNQANQGNNNTQNTNAEYAPNNPRMYNPGPQSSTYSWDQRTIDPSHERPGVSRSTDTRVTNNNGFPVDILNMVSSQDANGQPTWTATNERNRRRSRYLR